MRRTKCSITKVLACWWTPLCMLRFRGTLMGLGLDGLRFGLEGYAVRVRIIELGIGLQQS